jgi:hypothetical protein
MDTGSWIFDSVKASTGTPDAHRVGEGDGRRYRAGKGTVDGTGQGKGLREIGCDTPNRIESSCAKNET